jgi:HEAT repeat protein
MFVNHLLVLSVLIPASPAAAQTNVAGAETRAALRQAERALREAERALARAPRILVETERALALSPRMLAEAEQALAESHAAMAETGLRFRIEIEPDSWNELDVRAPAPWQSQDPGDSLYRRARQALNSGEYARAAELFRDLRARHPRSSYVADSYYYEAYALYKRNTTESFRRASALLAEQEEKHPRAATRGDARSLETRIRGELARRGDEASAAYLAGVAREAAPPQPPQAAQPAQPANPPAPPSPSSRRTQRCDDEDDIQIQALNALMQMDDDRALPILQRVLARRDAGSDCLRRKAVFIVSQIDGAQVESILLNAARTDPDTEVRLQAVFWLSQVDSESAVAALDSILTRETNREIQEKAIFALSQHDSRTARQALRRYAERSDIPTELRQNAVFWIGQSDDPENAQFLRGLFSRTQDRELKDKILFSLSQIDDASSARFLGEVARNQSEHIEVRKKALFWLSQKDGFGGSEMAGLYGTFTEREIKEQVIFALSQMDDKAAVDKLIDIARREPDRELRKKAIFWLGQSDDPRVADVLAELLTKP